MPIKSVNPVIGGPRRPWVTWLLRLALVGLAVLAIAFLASRLLGLRSTQIPEAPVVPVVRIEMATTQPLEIYQRYTGTIAARERFAVAAQVNATVLAVPKREGERVLRGELLAVLDATEFRAEEARQQASVERLQAELTYWKAQLVRNKALYTSSAVSQQTLEDSQRQVRTLQASVKESREALSQATTRLGYTEIRAPSDGFVQSVYSLPGDLARAGAPLLELLDDRSLKVTITLPQDDLATLEVATPAIVEIAGLDYRANGALDRLYPALDAQTRTATGEVFLADSAAGLRPGMLATVSLRLLQLDTAITVPIHAIHYRTGMPGVFVDSDGTAEWRAVRTGQAVEDRMHIIEGLEAGAAIIVTPDSRLADGVSINRALAGAAQ